MTNINEKILQAMQDEHEDYQSLEEKSTVLGLIAQSFKGTFRYTFVFVVLMQLTFAGLVVFCGYHLLHAADAASKVDWLAGVMVSAIAFGIARLWFFMELNRLSVLREIKRVEMQIALLSAKL